jgi:hypothetical protein
LTLGIALLLAACVPVAFSETRAGSSGSAYKPKVVGGKIKFTVRDVTPPDDVGRDVVVQVTGEVVTGKSKLRRSCRPDRLPQIVVGPHGPANTTGHAFDLFPTSRKGRFKGTFPLDYGGYYEDELYSGDIDFAGGEVPFRARVSKLVHSASVGGPFGTLVKCKAIATPPALLTVPPADTE